jgi:hypothetical protein
MNNLVMHLVYYIFRLPKNHEHHDLFIHIYTYLSGSSLPRLANCPSWSCPWVTSSEPFPQSSSPTLILCQLVCLGPPSSLLFVPTIHISHVQTPFTTRRFNTFIQVNIMGAQYNIYNRHLTTFLLMLLLYLWAGQLTPDFHVGNKSAKRSSRSLIIR